jgi:hypothetical protein
VKIADEWMLIDRFVLGWSDGRSVDWLICSVFDDEKFDDFSGSTKSHEIVGLALKTCRLKQTISQLHGTFCLFKLNQSKQSFEIESF